MDARALIDLFKAWHACAPMLVYTGRRTNASKMAQIMPVFTAFATEYAAWIRLRWPMVG